MISGLISGPLILGLVIAAVIAVLRREGPWATIADLRAKHASERIANRHLRTRIRRLQDTLEIYRLNNEHLQARTYTAERERDAALLKLAKAHRRDPRTGRILPAGE